MKKKSLFKNKWQMIIYTIIFIICLILCIKIGTTDYSKDKVKDNIKFSELYKNVPTDNVFKFVNASTVLNILNGRSGIILMGFPTNNWTNYLAGFVNEVAKEVNISEILYYDFLEDRENNNGTYETLVNSLDAYVYVNDLGNKDLQAPTLMIIKDGNIIGFFDETSVMKGIVNPDTYYTPLVINKVKEEIKMVFLEYME